MKTRNDNSNFSMTTCSKTGIKIKNSGNDYKVDPFANINPFANQVVQSDSFNVNYDKTNYETIDLNIENYSREELYKLFGFRTSIILNEENMKEAKKIVLKTHPDKSRLDNKYFIFFNKAYKKLQDIYEFQNKTNSRKTIDKNEYFDKDNGQMLDKMFDVKKDLKETGNFNKWFNEQFEKHRLDDPVENGYGNWLKSDEDIIFTPQNINKDSMAREMDKRKKEIQALTPYTGVGSSFGGSSVGGSSLMEYNSNFTSGSLFTGGAGVGFTDLRQAYVESVIPVTEDDFNKTQKFRSVDEYKRHRDTVNVTPLSKEEAMRQLLTQEKRDNEESAALAFYYAQQAEKAKKNSETFWSGLKQITNW
jgi:curved DNA-binding protein CbpA